MSFLEETSTTHAENMMDFLEITVNMYDPIINNETRRVLEVIFFNVVSAAVSVAGSGAGIINIIIFLKQGFKDSVNISLFGLALSDMGILLTLLLMSISRNPLLQYTDTDLSLAQVVYITASMPHTTFVWTTSWITAFITFERCVCIALPMKVKNIITAKRTCITIVIIFVVTFAGIFPMFLGFKFVPKFNSKINQTLYTQQYFSYGQAFRRIAYDINVIIVLSSFISLIICDVILIYNLRAKSRWRRQTISASSSRSSDSTSSRDNRVMKMIATISSIFVICYLPTTINCLLVISFPADYSQNGRYQNCFIASWAVVTALESVNSAVSSLVYYSMSSKFRSGFRELFGNSKLNVKC